MKVTVGPTGRETGRQIEVRSDEPLEPIQFQGKRIRFAGPVEVTARLDVQRQGILAHVRAHGKLILTCDRCLSEFERPFDLEYTELYQTEEQAQAAPQDEPDETRRYSPPVLDLTEGLHENLVLDLPVKQLCRPDCKGICPVCGRNRNEEPCDCRVEDVDPRLEKLRQLLPGDDS